MLNIKKIKYDANLFKFYGRINTKMAKKATSSFKKNFLLFTIFFFSLFFLFVFSQFL